MDTATLDASRRDIYIYIYIYIYICDSSCKIDMKHRIKRWLLLRVTQSRLTLFSKLVSARACSNDERIRTGRTASETFIIMNSNN